MKIRADELVLRAGLALDLAQARALILAGEIFCGENRVDKAGDRLDAGSVLRRHGRRGPFASRAGAKLAGALDRFGLDPRGRRALDIGSSTGGFTDCLLQRGAAQVVAVDVGRGLLDGRLRSDPRVAPMEGRNARDLQPSDFPHSFDIVTVDVSFISLALIVPVIPPLLSTDAPDVLLMVKPQFEAARSEVEPGGVVTDPDVVRRAVDRIAHRAEEVGLHEKGRGPSPVKGASGNQEHFLWLTP